MSQLRKLTRRQVLKGAAAAGALGMLGSLDRIGEAWGASDKVKMGFIFVGPRDDYGYNQAHFEGKAAVAKLDWVKAFDEEKVPETIEVQKTMESMVKWTEPRCSSPHRSVISIPTFLRSHPTIPLFSSYTVEDSIRTANILKTSAVISATSMSLNIFPVLWQAG